jgi:hypothetical protein
MEPLALTIPELPKWGGPKRDTAYKAIKRGQLIARKRGRSTVILFDDLKRYLAALPAIAPTGESQPEPRPHGHGQRRGHRRRRS